MFFGHLKQAWGIFKKPYRLSHSLLYIDFDNCLYLTNELLKRRELSENDREYYLKLRELKKIEFRKKKTKQKESTENYKKRKKSNSFILEDLNLK